MTDGWEMRYVREEMGRGEVSLNALAHHLGVTAAELAEMEAGTRSVPPEFFDKALHYVGALAERDAERERKAHGN